MRFRGCLLALAAIGCWSAGAGCSFNPAGGELGDDDVPGDDGGGGGTDGGGTPDGPPGTIDAPAVAVDAPIDAPAGCPLEYAVTVGTSRYAKRTTPRGPETARADCNDDLAGRTRLATFENPADLAVVMDELADNNELLWVGARCQFELQGCDGPGSWSWDTAIDIETSMWIPPEPDNPFSELGAVAAKRASGWGLRSASTFFPARTYVCECTE